MSMQPAEDPPKHDEPEPEYNDPGGFVQPYKNSAQAVAPVVNTKECACATKQ